jgi:sugar lactone lactonase YvrE
MGLQHYLITGLSAAVALVGCSAAQLQGVPPAFGSKAAATQDAIGPLKPPPRRLLYIATLSEVSVYPQRGSDQQRIGVITKDIHLATGLAVDKSESLYVSDLGNATVTVYPRGSNTPLETLTNAGRPYGIAVNDDGTIYVANEGTTTETPSILVYPKGQRTPSQAIPTKGTPFGLALDTSGNLYATVNRKLRRSDYRGAVYEFERGSPKGRNLGLRGFSGRLTGIAIDKQNNLLVLDFHTHDLYIFGPGKTRPSQTLRINYRDPLDIAINRENTEIWVSTFSGNVEGISYPRGTLLDVVHDAGLTTAVSPASNV